jgi:hypothetical protein
MDIPEHSEDMSDMSDDDVEGEFSVLTLVDNARSKSFIASPGVYTCLHARAGLQRVDTKE